MKAMPSIAIYAAPIRDGAAALRVIFAFRTVSTDASVVISGIMPLGLVVDVEKRKRGTRQGIDISNPVQLVEDAMEK